MNSTEAIWQLSTPLPESYNTQDAENFILLGAPNTFASYNSTTISPELMNAFESGDRRRIDWIDSFPAPPNTYYFPYKYQNLTSTPAEYTVVLRLAEQYLIRAEAEAELGDSTDATIDLNVIRYRAGLLPYSLALNGPLLSAILHERQVELFTEWGHRWFDLIRTGMANSLMGSPGNVCHMKGGVWNPDWQLYPIPQTEVATDVNLTQNNGY